MNTTSVIWQEGDDHNWFLAAVTKQYDENTNSHHNRWSTTEQINSEIYIERTGFLFFHVFAYIVQIVLYIRYLRCSNQNCKQKQLKKLKLVLSALISVTIIFIIIIIIILNALVPENYFKNTYLGVEIFARSIFSIIIPIFLYKLFKKHHKFGAVLGLLYPVIGIGYNFYYHKPSLLQHFFEIQNNYD